jgi:hypothetical protein
MAITVVDWMRKVRRERYLDPVLLRNAEWVTQAREAPSLLANWLRDHPDGRPGSVD